MSENGNHRLFLLDAFALIYRAYFAFSKNPLINSKGFNVSAVTGFMNTLQELLDKEDPTHIAVVFDTPEATERATEFEFYKANREEMPEDIAKSIPVIKEILKAFHIPILELPGYEADDIVGTIAKQKAKEGHKVYMVTPDKDYAQLVEENIFMYIPRSSFKPMRIMGVKEVCEKWEIEDPMQVIDILGMWGDSVDNIPGIPGIGEKTAKKLVQEFGSLEGVLENTDKLKGKMQQNVIEFAEQGRISKQLATIILDVPIDYDDDDLTRSEPDKEKLAGIFAELEFRTLGKKILGEEYSPNQARSTNGQMDLFGASVEDDTDVMIGEGNDLSNTKHDYHLADSQSSRKELIKILMKANEVCFDTETTSLDALQTELVGLSFSIKAGEAWYVPVPADREKAQEICAEFKAIFERTDATFIGQNIKFDMLVIGQYGLEIKGKIFDTMVAHYLIEPDKRHKMDFLAETYLGYTPVPIEDLIGKKGKNQKSMRDIAVDKVSDYAAEDADITLQLKEKFAPMLEERELEDLAYDLEMPLIPVLADMEKEGVAIDKEFLEQYSDELADDILKIRDRVFEAAGREFNLDSPKQLGTILFDEMGIPYKGKKTKTGQYSTNEETLSKLDDDQPIIADILEYREIAKLKSTYVDALPALVHPKTGRIHTTFNQTIAATGRLSSIQPNLQNIPIRTERGRRVRQAFIPRDKDHILLAADYSQIELRLVTELSGDEAMLEAFEKGLDIHAATAAKVYGVKLEDVSSEQRRKAKMVNFGIIYSISAFGLSQRLRIPKSEAAELIENYFREYPGIKKFMDDTVESARELGYVKTIMGRRRYLKDIQSRNYTVRSAAEREAINAPVQGSAADMIKIAMIDIDKALKSKGFKSRMTLQVHDELVFDAHKDEVDELKELVIDLMQHAIELKVPILVEAGIGENWLQAH